MYTTSLTGLLLGSAAIGALVSSVVTLIGQQMERRSRRRELLFTKALELSSEQIRLLQDVAEKHGKPVTIYPHLVYARWYYAELKQLFGHERLSDQMEEKHRDFFSRHDL